MRAAVCLAISNLLGQTSFRKFCLSLSLLQPGNSRTMLAVADAQTGDIHIYDIRGESNQAVDTFKVGHSSTVTHMRYNAQHDCVISTDSKGGSPQSLQRTAVLICESSTFFSPDCCSKVFHCSNHHQVEVNQFILTF